MHGQQNFKICDTNIRSITFGIFPTSFVNLTTLAIFSVFITISATKMAIGRIPRYNMYVHLVQFILNIDKFIQVKKKSAYKIVR